MTSGSSDITSNTYYDHIQLAAVKLIDLENQQCPSWALLLFFLLSAPEGKVKLEQSPPSCLPVNKSQKVTGEILFLVSDFLTTKLNNNFFIFQKTSFLNQLSKNGNEILRLGTTKFSKKYGKQNMGKRLGH